MATFKVYMYGKLMETRSEPYINTIADFKKSAYFTQRFGNAEYVDFYKVVKAKSPSSSGKGKRVNKVKALMDAFGYSQKEAKMFLKDMGE